MSLHHHDFSLKNSGLFRPDGYHIRILHHHGNIAVMAKVLYNSFLRQEG